MGKLDDLRKRLFRSRETFEEREGEPKLSPLHVSGPRAWNERPESDREAEIRHKQRLHTRIMFWLTVAGAFGLLAAAAILFVILRNTATVTEENILLSISAPSKITVGEQVVFEVRYRNGNNVPLESVELIFDFPEGARPLIGNPPRGRFRERVTIGRLASGEEGTARFEAFLFGTEDSVLEARTTIEYRPENSSARFGKEITYGVRIDRSPVGVTVSMPKEANIGQEIEIILDYVSTSESLLENVSLDVLYPSGFEFISAEPAPNKENNFWSIGGLASGGTGSIAIRGTIAGQSLETKYVDVRLGIFNEQTSSWNVYGQTSEPITLRESLLAIELLVNESKDHAMPPGTGATFKVNWRNNLPVSVRNAIIEVSLSGQTLDFTSIRVVNGSYDGASRRIVWNASNQPNLQFIAPGQSGSFSFTASFLKNPSITSLNDKNFIASVEGIFFTNTVPEGFEGVETTGRDSVSVRMTSRLGFASKGLHRSGVITNSGPVPPRVGQETTYTITWSLTTLSNDVENMTVEAILPAYAQWGQVVNPSGEQVVFDPDTGKIFWDAGFLVAGTGFTRPAREVSFQVIIIPGENQVGRSPQIIGSTKALGKDAFTGVILSQAVQDVTTALHDDPLVSGNDYRVAR